MTEIRPFRAVVYNQDKIKDLAGVVCPPYDVISVAEQERYHELSPYNFIHILFGRDIPADDKYERASRYFKDWLAERILIQQDRPGIYFYAQDYKIRGEKKTRWGFIALLGLEEDNVSIFAHENTRAMPCEDRLKLLKAVKANLSPIFVVFSDKQKIIQRVSARCLAQGKPFIDITDNINGRHRIWRVDSSDILNDIENKMSRENIFIADGHHRYEVACAYRQEMKKVKGALAADGPFNYILAYFTNTDPKGLTILPIHRLVKLPNSLNIGGVLSLARDYFDVEEIKDQTKFFFLLEKAGKSEHVLGLYKDKRYWLLRLKNIRILDKIIPDKPKEYRALDTAILNYLVLEDILKLKNEDKENIIYSQDARELIEAVDQDRSCVAFFLNPAAMQQIMDVALTGNKMPPKSTFFYPKVLSGLVINKHEEN